MRGFIFEKCFYFASLTIKYLFKCLALLYSIFCLMEPLTDNNLANFCVLENMLLTLVMIVYFIIIFLPSAKVKNTNVCMSQIRL